MASKSQTSLMLQRFRYYPQWMSKIFLLVLFLVVFAQSFEVPPGLRFKTIETPHFYVVVDEK